MKVFCLALLPLCLSLAGPASCLDAQGNIQTGDSSITLTMAGLGGEEAARAAEPAIAADEAITWKIYVPAQYSEDKPAGLLVYISPSPSGHIPRRWKAVMDELNMIWIAADESGNEVPVARRSIFAIVAPDVAASTYTIDRERIYLSGFSGGGKVASMIAPGTTQKFRGAIYIGGVESWEDHPHDPVEWIARNHYVFLSGTEDFNENLTRRMHKQYVQAGVENSKLMVIPRMGHRLPRDHHILQAIRYLDSRQVEEAANGQNGHDPGGD